MISHGAISRGVPLTTIRQPVRALGAAAVKLLDAQVNGLPAGSEELLLEPELIVRGSTGPCRSLV
jgi:DNA-binding LacI/PurR family transcriptional regulator